jgi:tetratricopeptide (TPR) repeat protein
MQVESLDQLGSPCKGAQEELYGSSLRKNSSPKNSIQIQEIYDTKTDELGKLQSNALVLLQHNLDEEAYVLLIRAMQINPRNNLTLGKMYEVCIRLGKYDQAKSVAIEAMREFYGFETIVQCAQIFYLLGQDHKSLDLFLEALSVLNSEHVALFEIYKNMGNICVRLQDYEAAQEYYDKACTLQPESDVLFVNYGTLEIQRGDYDKALECFREAVRMNRRNSKAWVGMAMIHDQRSDFELAWGNVIQAFEFDEDNKTALLLIYQWSKRDHRELQGKKCLLKYLCRHDLDEEVSLWLIHLCLSLGQYDEARMEVEKVLLFNPANDEAQEIQFILTERK